PFQGAGYQPAQTGPVSTQILSGGREQRPAESDQSVVAGAVAVEGAAGAVPAERVELDADPGIGEREIDVPPADLVLALGLREPVRQETANDAHLGNGRRDRPVDPRVEYTPEITDARTPVG